MKSRKLKIVILSFAIVAVSLVGGLFYQAQRAAHSLEAVALKRRLASTPQASTVRFLSSRPVPVIIALDEMVANLSINGGKSSTLVLKLDLEIFDEEYRKLIEKRQGGVKHRILELARGQTSGDLGTVSGKLYFKEQLVASLNSFLNQPAVRDIHFATFLIR